MRFIASSLRFMASAFFLASTFSLCWKSGFVSHSAVTGWEKCDRTTASLVLPSLVSVRGASPPVERVAAS